MFKGADGQEISMNAHGIRDAVVSLSGVNDSAEPETYFVFKFSENDFVNLSYL